MPNLIIKPQNTSGNKVLIQDQGSVTRLQTDDAGVTITAPTIASMANCTFPDGHIIYFDNFNFTSTGAASDPGTSLVDTSLTITVPAATANICDKIYVSVSNACVIATGTGTLSIGYFKIARSAPTAVDLAIFDQLGVQYACYPNTTMCGVDESLSNADHTYKLVYGSGTQSAAYSGNITYHGQSGMKVSISVMGIK